MKPDSNTKNHFQWFNFKICVKKANRRIKFIIRNFIKSAMLYSKGLRSLKMHNIINLGKFNHLLSFIKISLLIAIIYNFIILSSMIMINCLLLR